MEEVHVTDAYTLDFANKTALVTGAGSGIGAAIAEELAARGAFVVVSDLTADKAAPVVARIATAGGRAVAHGGDVADPACHNSMVALAVRNTGALHLAVNNAGIGGPLLPVGEYPHDDWRRVIDINLNGVFYGMRAQIPEMKAAGGGAIVNMSSILGSVGFRGAGAYVAAKHALLGLGRAAALDHAGDGIRVNTVGPAFIATPLLTDNLTDDMLAGLAGLHPQGRIGKPEEVSALTCFLLSDRASFITGSYHLVDGGYTAQ
jgi:NAD(P)-dependent dehydrogenase (short-subunit alcohol dehydrogenase family)